MREELLDGTGRVVAHYDRRTRLDLPYAAELEPVDISAEDLVRLLFTERKGWVFSAGPEICLPAKANGGTVVRHAHAYSFDLREQQADPDWLNPPLADGLRAEEFTATLEEIFPAYQRAFPPGHVDHVLDAEGERANFAQLLAGEVLGPVLPCSGLIRDGEEVVGVVVVNDRAGDPPLLGPWIGQIYRDPAPRYRGLGMVLLRRAVALAAQAGLPAVGLAVTDGNPARWVYEKAGFRHVEESMTVLIPD
ncbi:GNAT family N-acetyltransferase [Crossiella sp. SN42]|uniref:GNAT family N-acetyltransferase n=1 Tax=Crossiella sp. SN42 TaxID=2944808 RepID=UPI00207D4FF5|nr:GNAT family N-acetyltransferase [Crossiella sp. SN42]MCO1578483.1 GNAT family N-acetyltransferase [Crossiella sp. SN42]